jgi:hypothetical protein
MQKKVGSYESTQKKVGSYESTQKKVGSYESTQKPEDYTVLNQFLHFHLPCKSGAFMIKC